MSSDLEKAQYLAQRWKDIAENRYTIDDLAKHRDEVREKVAALMIRTGIATGHGDTLDDLLGELEVAILELQKYKVLFPQKVESMDVLFDLLEKHGIDYSHLIP